MGTAEQVGQYKGIRPFVEIMDSTLRDGEQTNGVSFLPHEKLIIARMLLSDLNVDRIEVASARVSEGEKEAVGMICRYAEKIDKLDRVETECRLGGRLWCEDHQPSGERVVAPLYGTVAKDPRGTYRRHHP